MACQSSTQNKGPSLLTLNAGENYLLVISGLGHFGRGQVRLFGSGTLFILVVVIWVGVSVDLKDIISSYIIGNI